MELNNNKCVEISDPSRRHNTEAPVNNVIKTTEQHIKSRSHEGAILKLVLPVKPHILVLKLWNKLYKL